MNKQLTFLLSLTFLFLFSGSSVVFGQEEVEKEYWGNGQLYSEVPLKNGKRDSEWTFWDWDGQKSWEGNYKDGKRDGKWTSWYENGQKRREEYWQDGERIKVTLWDKDGKKH